MSDVNTITQGESLNLYALYIGSSATIDNGVGNIATGTTVLVSPTVTTTYTLTVSNGAGHTSTATFTVTVNPGTTTTAAPTTTTVPTSTTTTTVAPSSITYFLSGATSITQGESTYLWASYSGASATVDNGIGAFPNALSVTISPTVTTTYTLTVSNGAGHTSTATLTITVNAPTPSTTVAPSTTTTIPATTTTTVPASTTTTVPATTTTTTLAPQNNVSISSQPVSTSASLGSTHTFSVTASGSGTLSYQWVLDGVYIQGATTSSFVASDAGTYEVIVSSTLNGNRTSVTSNAVQLTINAGTITSHPTDLIVTSGQTKFLNVGFTSIGGMTVSYQWLRDNTEVVGATSQSYAAGTAGTYKVRITTTRNGATKVQYSNTATVSIVDAPAISSFTPSPATIYRGNSTTFTPVFTGGTGVVNPGNIAVTSGQTITVSPTVTTNYVLTVTNAAGGTGSRNTDVTVTTGTVTYSANNSSVSRYTGSTSVTLANGKVLVFGKADYDSAITDIYDPTTNRFTQVGNMNQSRGLVAGVRLQNGKVFVAGGFFHTGLQWSARSTAELFDPVTNTWSYTGTMSTSRRHHFTIKLADGRVMIGGGTSASGSALTSAEIYDPATETFTLTATIPDGRYGASAALLPNGNVIVFGGYGNNTYLKSAMVYDVVSNTWSYVTSQMNDSRSDATVVTMADGRIIIAGGWSGTQGVSSIEIFDPSTNTFQARSGLPGFWHGRERMTGHLLNDGRVAFFGGSDGLGNISNEIVVFDPTTNRMIVEANGMTVYRYNHSSALLNDGRVFIIGGNLSNGVNADIYTP